MRSEVIGFIAWLLLLLIFSTCLLRAIDVEIERVDARDSGQYAVWVN
jgi:hypothetical protein